jgi:farnesyl-diphosphate farnesyltransferase
METRWTFRIFCVSIPSIMARGQYELQGLLKRVSRSFYLTLGVLPNSIRKQISLSYLLARATDTIADTQLLQLSRRREALLQFRESIHESCEGRPAVLPDFGDLTEAQETASGEGTPAERALLERFGELLHVLQAFASEDRLRICKLLDTIIHGQETDLVRFGTAGDPLTALDTEEELDAYTYNVAGCVGEFWTEMCRAHIFPAARLDDAFLRTNGILFGKGLQLVNMLRDLPKDLRRGRCYIPKHQLAKHSLNPGELLDKESMGRFRPLYEMYLGKAGDYLSAGWQYTTALPYRFLRIRLACAWPVLIGMRTLEKLRQANVLDEGRRVKVSRSEIRRLMLQSTILYANPRVWNRLFVTAGNKGPG